MQLLATGVGALLAAACIYHADDRCGEERVLKNGYCVCPDGEVDMDGTCVKKTEAPSGLGVACDVTDTPCADATFSECHLTDASSGYCTSTGCSTDAECGGDYYCAVSESPTFCKRTPTGQGAICTTSDDCKDFDATYCAMSPTGKLCVVINCTDTSCSPGYACMDFSAFQPGIPKLCAKPF
jgi:hypothetical protein